MWLYHTYYNNFTFRRLIVRIIKQRPSTELPKPITPSGGSNFFDLNSENSVTEDYTVVKIIGHSGFNKNRIIDGDNISVLIVEHPIQLSSKSGVNAACYPQCKTKYNIIEKAHWQFIIPNISTISFRWKYVWSCLLKWDWNSVLGSRYNVLTNITNSIFHLSAVCLHFFCSQVMVENQDLKLCPLSNKKLIFQYFLIELNVTNDWLMLHLHLKGLVLSFILETFVLEEKKEKINVMELEEHHWYVYLQYIIFDLPLAVCLFFVLRFASQKQDNGTLLAWHPGELDVAQICQEFMWMYSIIWIS